MIKHFGQIKNSPLTGCLMPSTKVNKQFFSQFWRRVNFFHCRLLNAKKNKNWLSTINARKAMSNAEIKTPNTVCKLERNHSLWIFVMFKKNPRPSCSLHTGSRSNCFHQKLHSLIWWLPTSLVSIFYSCWVFWQNPNSLERRISIFWPNKTTKK